MKFSSFFWVFVTLAASSTVGASKTEGLNDSTPHEENKKFWKRMTVESDSFSLSIPLPPKKGMMKANPVPGMMGMGGMGRQRKLSSNGSTPNEENKKFWERITVESDSFSLSTPVPPKKGMMKANPVPGMMGMGGMGRQRRLASTNA